MLLITWTEGVSRGYVDLLPDELLSASGPLELVHSVLGPKGGGYLARCAVTAHPRAVELDYGAFPEFNSRRGMYLGVMRIRVSAAGEPVEVTWKDPGPSSFQGGEAIATMLVDVTLENYEVERLARAGSTETDPQLIAARRGQGQFREGLMRRWQGRCALTGVSVEAVLRASHMKPWVEAKHDERLDPENGLLLAAHVDALFDRYLISFTPTGELRWRDGVPKDDRAILGLPTQLRQDLSAAEKAYLAEHFAVAFA